MAELRKFTWDDLEKRALTDPVLHGFVTHVRQGNLTREQAAIAAALVLCDTADSYRQELVGQRERERPPIWRNLEIQQSIAWLQKIVNFAGTTAEAETRARNLILLLEQLQREQEGARV